MTDRRGCLCRLSAWDTKSVPSWPALPGPVAVRPLIQRIDRTFERLSSVVFAAGLPCLALALSLIILVACWFIGWRGYEGVGLPCGSQTSARVGYASPACIAVASTLVSASRLAFCKSAAGAARAL
jgi:hypothetical protein